MVEIRLDYIRRQINLKRLLRDECPVIATCRPGGPGEMGGE